MPPNMLYVHTVPAFGYTLCYVFMLEAHVLALQVKDEDDSVRYEVWCGCANR